ncbi:MAG: hypothetical protein M0P69_12475 [Bacteroidales bacterium]|nr:hypothetical protein [Bacteroidales bacterium]
MTDKCPMCEAGAIGMQWSRDIIIGKVGIEEAAMFFKMTRNEVMDHINTHQIKEDKSTGEYNSEDFYMKRLLNMLKKLEDWVDYVCKIRDFDRENIKLAIMLTKETRATLHDLAEFQGRLNLGGNVNVRIEKMNHQYIELTNVIVQEVCPSCRKKVLEAIDNLPAIEVTTV